MQIYTDFNKKSERETAVALGYFDGLHLAHRKIIDYAMYSSRRFIPTVFTFSLENGQNKGKTSQKALMSTNEKISALEEIGVSRLYIPPFESIKNLTAEEFFFDILLGSMNAKKLICGFNFRFGKGNTGDVNLLKNLCEQNEIDLIIVDEMKVDGEAISSTAIRKYLSEGNCEKLKAMMGDYYTIFGEVVHGASLGRKLNFPTINQTLENNRAPLRFGVYFSKVLVGDKWREAITNVGVKPTVNGEKPCVETHLINFTGDIYGEKVKVRLIKFLRDEKKFENLESLKKAVEEDINKAKKYFNI